MKSENSFYVFIRTAFQIVYNTAWSLCEKMGKHFLEQFDIFPDARRSENDSILQHNGNKSWLWSEDINNEPTFSAEERNQFDSERNNWKSDVSKLNTMSVSLKKLDLKFMEMVIVSRMQNCLSSKTIKFLFQIWISYAP